MKYSSVIAIFLLSFLSISLYGQGIGDLPRYEFNKQPDEAYNALTQAAVQFALPLNWDDEQSEAVAMPFPFFYQNVLVGSLRATGNGSLVLNDAVNPDAELGNIVGLTMDYESKNRGKVLYELTGSIPNRIFKVEYNNIGLFDDTLGVDSLNFQIWLYEGTYVIEYRAGISNVPDTMFAQNTIDFFFEQKKVLHMGLFQNQGDVLSENPSNIYFQFVKGDDTDSLIYFPDMMVSGIENAYVKGSYKKFPVESSVFRFTPKDNATSVFQALAVRNKIFPNPSSTGEFNVLLEQATKSNYKIFDINGVAKMAGAIHDGYLKLDLSPFTKGVYFLHISINDKIESVKLIYK